MANSWQVIVGNIGTVYDGANGAEAMRVYGEYKRQSKAACGRAAHEAVMLFCNGEVHHEYAGTLPPEVDANKPRVCPVCADAACETKDETCGT